MEPHKKAIKIRRGDTKEIFFRVRTKVWNTTTLKYEPGPYKDLTGFTVTSQIRLLPESSSVLLTFVVTLGNQADVTSGRGAVYMKIAASNTAAVPSNVGEGHWDVQFVDPLNDVFTYIEGPVSFSGDVTRV